MIQRHIETVVTDTTPDGTTKVRRSERDEPLFTAQELKEHHDKGFQAAYSQWCEGALDYEWWDSVYDWADEAASTLGIRLARKRGRNGKGEAIDTGPTIWFSGFWSQGDGASWEGAYAYEKGAAAQIRKDYPEETELHRIAAELQEVQRRWMYRVTASVSKPHRGENSGCMSVDVSLTDDRSISRDDEEIVTQLLRDFADWIYQKLKKEAEYLQSEEQFLEATSDDLFTEDGTRR